METDRAVSTIDATTRGDVGEKEAPLPRRPVRACGEGQ
jgi:hypothetical protein